jgi:predicted Zn-dependent peptidase
VHNKTGAEIGTYWTINVIKTVEALDWDRTRWKEKSKIEEKYPRDKYPLLYIIEIALRSEAVTGIDCFRLIVNNHIHGGLFISDRMKEYIEQQGSSTGLYFIKVPVYRTT